MQKTTFPLPVQFPVCLAPMVGLSHVALREVVQEYLPEGVETIWPSEMLSSRRIPSENLADVAEAMRADDEKFWVPQILGNEEKYIELSVKKLVDYGAHGIDINMGCPVQKALRHNYGVALMGDVDYAARVVEMTVRHAKVPVSVKLRAGFENSLENMIPFMKRLEGAGASWLTLHPRTAEQKRRGTADWPQIKAVKEALQIPVIGNGDVQIADDVFKMLAETSCDMVMIGRALTARPWLFWQVGERLGLPSPPGKTGLAPRSPEEEGQEFYHCAKKILQEMHARFRPVVAHKKYQFYIKTSSTWLEYGHFLYSKTTKCQSQDEMEKVLDDFFSSEQRMVARTEWRI
jgi:tRNA-dihydrouridine synthase B